VLRTEGVARLRLRDPRYLAVFAVLAAAALLLGGTIPRAAFFLWIGLGVLDLGWAFLSVRQLGALYRTPGGTLTAGDGLPAELHLDNDGWLPCVAVTLRDGPGARVHFVREAGGEVVALGSFDGVPQMRRQLSAQRGRYRLGPLELIASGPFGIAEARRQIWSERTVTVLPRLKPLPSWPARRREPLAGRAVLASPFTDPAQVAGARPLLPSDPPRRIHWKRSARVGSWQVREMEPAAGGATLLVLDLHGPAYRGRAGSEASAAALCDDAVEITAAIAHAALSRGDQLAFVATGRHAISLPPSRGFAAVAALLEALAQARADGQRPLLDWLQRDLRRQGSLGRSTIVVVTPADGEAEGWAQELAGVRRFGAEPMAVQVLAPSTDRDVAARRVGMLQRLGLTVWAARDAEDLARQLAPVRGLALR
jgi:uncharacterized protein (DUF58 family)